MFRLHTPLVVIDLEATLEKDERGYQRNDHIIDVGAVLIGTDLQILARWEALVKPPVRVSEFITKLTGITNEQLADQPDWAVVGPAFEAWVKSQIGNPKKARLAAWGNYFDIPLLRANYQDRGLDFPFAGTALDVKTVAFLWQSLSGRRTDKLNLEIMAKDLGLEPDGRLHRALTDADLTARVLIELWHQLQGVFVPGPKEGEPWTHLKVSL